MENVIFFIVVGALLIIGIGLALAGLAYDEGREEPTDPPLVDRGHS